MQTSSFLCGKDFFVIIFIASKRMNNYLNYSTWKYCTNIQKKYRKICPQKESRGKNQQWKNCEKNHHYMTTTRFHEPLLLGGSRIKKLFFCFRMRVKKKLSIKPNKQLKKNERKNIFKHLLLLPFCNKSGNWFNQILKISSLFFCIASVNSQLHTFFYKHKECQNYLQKARSIGMMIEIRSKRVYCSLCRAPIMEEKTMGGCKIMITYSVH